MGGTYRSEVAAFRLEGSDPEAAARERAAAEAARSAMVGLAAEVEA